MAFLYRNLPDCQYMNGSITSQLWNIMIRMTQIPSPASNEVLSRVVEELLHLFFLFVSACKDSFYTV